MSNRVGILLNKGRKREKSTSDRGRNVPCVWKSLLFLVREGKKPITGRKRAKRFYMLEKKGALEEEQPTLRKS